MTSYNALSIRLAPALQLRVGRHRSAIGIALVLVAQLMLILDATVVQVANPKISAALGFHPTTLLWIVNGYALSYGGLLLMGGRLGDVRGRLRTFRLGLAIFTTASLIAGLAPTAAVLIAARVAQGVGAALTAPSVLALLAVNAPNEAARQRAFALFAAVTGGGLSLGLLLGGVIVQVASWRWTMFINVPFGTAVLVLAPLFVAETERRPARFDLIGAVTATLGATALVLGLVSAPDHGWASPQTVGGLLIGALLLAGFAATERRVAEPMVAPALLRDLSRVTALLASMFVIAAQISTFYFAVQLMQTHLRMDALATGLGFLPMGLALFAGSRVVPRLVNRFGVTAVMVAGTTLQTAALVLLASRVGSTGGYWTIAFAPLLIDGIAIGIVLSPITTVAMHDVPADRVGSASGLFQTTQQLGAASGLAVVVTVYAAHSVPGHFLPGASDAFSTAAILAGLALVSALVLALRAARKPGSKNEADKGPGMNRLRALSR
jgi:EmrB/QacA subfamily drug resistance transporter